MPNAPSSILNHSLKNLEIHMPKNKDAYSRYKIIDQTLRRASFVKTSKLSEICSGKLGMPISIRTIQKDIRDLIEDTVLQIYAPIEYSHHHKAYYYSENVNEIFPAIELDEDEINALLFYGKINNQYENLGLFKDIKNAIEKVIDTTNIKEEYKHIFTNQPLILTEKTPPLKGSELLLKIIQALKQQKKIQFNYKKFGNVEVKERILSPYLLKEDRHMWYAVGFVEGRNRIVTFAVDRMTKVRIVNEPIIKVDFSPDEYFKFSFGITVPDDEPIPIILSFTTQQGNYIKTLPIHETQKIIHDNDSELQISIEIKPSYEFYSKILSYGADVKIISPQHIADKLRLKLLSTLNKY